MERARAESPDFIDDSRASREERFVVAAAKRRAGENDFASDAGTCDLPPVAIDTSLLSGSRSGVS
jgi:hypothetical protein